MRSRRWPDLSPGRAGKVALYLLHLEPRYRHAGHYLGFTEEPDVTRRVAEHLAGGAKASPLIKAAMQVGCRVTIARTWTGQGADRTRERRIKNTGTIPNYCPICRARRKTVRRASDGQLELPTATPEAAP